MFQFIISGETLQELVEKLKHSYEIASQQLVEQSVRDHLISTRIIDTSRKNRRWTDFELQFLKDNYMVKSRAWLAESLHRPPTHITGKLEYMYKRGLQRKSKKNGKIILS